MLPPRAAMKRLGRYRVVRTLGEGGMGRLYLAEMAGDGGFVRRVVLKVVRDELGGEFEAVLRDEARIAATLSHRNVVPVIGLERVGSKRLMVLEFVDGMDLRRLLRRVGKLPPGLAAYVASEVAAGLDYAHRHVDLAGRALKIVHRDVSPANILLSWEGEAKLTDFGIAKAMLTREVSAEGVKGNLGYMAPEQASSQEVDGRADVYSLGVILWEALAGANPRREGPLDELIRQARDEPVPPLPDGIAPPLLAAAVQRATARAPADRFASAAALREALLEVPGIPPDPARELAALLATARPAPGVAAALREQLDGEGEGTRARPSRARSRWRRPSLVLAATALVLAGALAIASRMTVAPPPPPRARPAAPPAADAAQPIDAAAAPGPCRLVLSSRPPGAHATIDDQVYGATPIELELPCRAAPYRIRLTLRGYSAWRGEAPLTDGQRALDAPMVAQGRLFLNAVPWANVQIDGRPAGHTPLQDLPLDAGPHQLRLTSAEGLVRTRTVAVEPGRATRLSVDF